MSTLSPRDSAVMGPPVPPESPSCLTKYPFHFEANPRELNISFLMSKRPTRLHHDTAALLSASSPYAAPPVSRSTAPSRTTSTRAAWCATTHRCSTTTGTTARSCGACRRSTRWQRRRSKSKRS